MPRLRDPVAAALLGLATFAIYAAGAARTAYVGDSGELVAAVGTLGIPHPSGYPLFVLTGYVWTSLLQATGLVTDVAHAMSLASAAFAAGTVGVVYLTIRRMGLSVPSALLGALMIAFAPSFWSQANVQRVYALGAFMLSLATYAFLAWHRLRRTSTLALAFFLCGLGAANHTFMAIAAIAGGLFMLATEPRLLTSPRATLQRAAVVFPAFAAGLIPYAYLPIRSAQNPRLDWGNPETLDGFIAVVSRRDFWERAWIESAADLLPIAGDYVRGLGAETLVVGALLAALGSAVGLSAKRPVLLPLLVMAGNFASMALHGSRSDIFIWHRYYIPSYMMVALLAALGWHMVSSRLPRRAAWAALALPLVMFASGYARHDRSDFTVAEDFADMVLDAVPPGGNLIATDDNVLFVLIYLHLVEGRRPDVNLILQGVGKADLPPLRFNPETEPLFFTHHPNWDLPSLEIVARGPVYQAWPADGEPPGIIDTPALLTEPNPHHDYLTQNLIGHFHYTRGFAYETRDFARAQREFDAAAAAAPENDVLFYNLGLLYARNGLYDQAVAAFERSNEINPRHLASTSPARASEKLAAALKERRRIEALEAEISGSLPACSEDEPSAYHSALAQQLLRAGEPAAARGRRLAAAMGTGCD